MSRLYSVISPPSVSSRCLMRRCLWSLERSNIIEEMSNCLTWWRGKIEEWSINQTCASQLSQLKLSQAARHWAIGGIHYILSPGPPAINRRYKRMPRGSQKRDSNWLPFLCCLYIYKTMQFTWGCSNTPLGGTCLGEEILKINHRESLVFYLLTIIENVPPVWSHLQNIGEVASIKILEQDISEFFLFPPPPSKKKKVDSQVNFFIFLLTWLYDVLILKLYLLVGPFNAPYNVLRNQRKFATVQFFGGVCSSGVHRVI